jgi:Ca2+/Na+ antiporter
MISAFVGVLTQDFMGCFLFSILGYILNNYRHTIKVEALIIIFVLGLLLLYVDSV